METERTFRGEDNVFNTTYYPPVPLEKGQTTAIRVESYMPTAMAAGMRMHMEVK